MFFSNPFAAASGSTIFSRLLWLNGSIPRACKSSTAFSSLSASIPSRCASRRAMRSCRAVGTSSGFFGVSTFFAVAVFASEPDLDLAAVGNGSEPKPSSLPLLVGCCSAACALPFGRGVGASPGRRMRNFLALGFVVIKRFRLLKGIKLVELAVTEHRCGTTKFLKRGCLVGDNNNRRSL